MAEHMHDPQIDEDGLHPDAPRQKSPVKWMVLVMVILIALTTATMWGREKISIHATVVVPDLTATGQMGRQLFAQKCQECHGTDGAGGTKKGPPLIHPMYRPDVYPDFVLKQVMRDGKREKNWRFGEMPADPKITDAEINAIWEFLRKTQVASGTEG